MRLKKMYIIKKYSCVLSFLLLSVCVILIGCVWRYFYILRDKTAGNSSEGTGVYEFGLSLVENIPSYSGAPYIEINNNVPWLTEDDYSENSFEIYSELDSLGRCGVAFACVGRDMMPEGEREPVGSIKPSGWHTVKYDFVDGKYLYNRCHLIAYQLSGENSNEKNLITGTRYMNVQGMLPFEIKVIDYVESTGNHVLYRVTPLYEENNLLAEGVLMEAWSVEDNGMGICFNVFVYNVQPGVEIDYETGESFLLDDSINGVTSGTECETLETVKYIINTNSYKFHYPTCECVSEMSERNKLGFRGSREELIGQGYLPCKVCQP